MLSNRIQFILPYRTTMSKYLVVCLGLALFAVNSLAVEKRRDDKVCD